VQVVLPPDVVEAQFAAKCLFVPREHLLFSLLVTSWKFRASYLRSFSLRCATGNAGQNSKSVRKAPRARASERMQSSGAGNYFRPAGLP